ncbi:MAG TPA: hypothetical protein VFV35_08065 [Acidimicrobiales bacterium]|nr:hypothetical protein [Acidimicrobiales bacterium]
MIAPLLAHESGFSWDELVFVAVPIVILLLLARQARRAVAEEPPEEASLEADVEGPGSPEREG